MSGDIVDSMTATGNTILVARRASDAVVLTRLDGTTGDVLATARFAVNEIASGVDASTVAFADSPAMLANNDSIYMIWEMVDSKGNQHNSTLLAIDPCHLELRAAHNLQTDVSPSLQQQHLALSGNRVWIANGLGSNTVSAFDASTLAEVLTVKVDNAWSLAEAGGQLWVCGDSLARLDVTGIVADVHSFGGVHSTSVLPAFAVGGRLFVADQHQLIEFDPTSGTLMGTHSGSSSALAALDGQVWTLDSQDGSQYLSTIPVTGAAVRVTTLNFTISTLALVATTNNLWAVDFAGNLYVY